MKKIFQKVTLVVGLIGMLCLIKPIISNAALQANPNTQYTKYSTVIEWMPLFRQMENAGGAMGLNETLNTDLTSIESNNIDVHMMRSTEYGAIAILSASGYGNPSNEQAITTTTGNNTGVMLNTNYWEWVAGTCTSFVADARYYDKYEQSSTLSKTGDALGSKIDTNPGARTWHSARENDWISEGNPYFRRGNYGIFSFDQNVGKDSSKYAFARGVAVCGEGL